VPGYYGWTDEPMKSNPSWPGVSQSRSTTCPGDSVLNSHKTRPGDAETMGVAIIEK
jgi:hypothetical protein